MNKDTKETAVFGGGCFCCTETLFKLVRGVQSVVSGYAGGARQNPSYEQVSSGATGHAEVIKIEFDPQQISYDELLDIFWHVHNPTTLNQQGADVGSQYRSIILYTSDDQQKKATAAKQAIEKSGEFHSPVVTQIQKLDTFYTAEEYHQNYFANNPAQPYCNFVIAPKLHEFLDKYRGKLKS